MTATPIFDAAQASKIRQAWADRARERNRDKMQAMRPVLVELPDSPPVLALKANLVTILEVGRIPDAITPFVWELIQGGQQAAALEAKIVDHWASWLKTLRAVWFACVVEPDFFLDTDDEGSRVTDEGGMPVPVPQGFQPFSEVTINDKLALFNWCQGVPDHLAAFRDPAGGAARAVAPVTGLPEVHPGGAPGAGALPGPDAGVADQPGGDALGPVRGRKARGADRGAGQPAEEGQAN